MNRYSSKKSLLQLAALLMVALATDAWGLEFEEWDTLPHVENMIFTASHVGIVSKDGRSFVLDRSTQGLQQVDPQTFTQQFPGPWPTKPYETLVSLHTQITVLRSSTGQELELTPAVCAEGAHYGHALRYQQRPFPDVLKHCSSVAGLEIIGTQIWFGTIRSDEGYDNPAEGIVVQSLDKKQKVISITAKSGLTGGQIRMLRDDPFTKTVWVATEWGLNQVDRQFRVVWGRDWYEEFEPSSQSSQIRLSATRKASNPFAVLGRELGVHDWMAYAQAIQQLSPSVSSKVRPYDFHVSAVPGGYFPRDMNVLLPFVFEAAQSEAPAVHSFGLWNVCKFDDPRVPTFMTTLADKTLANSADEFPIRECLKIWGNRKP